MRSREILLIAALGVVAPSLIPVACSTDTETALRDEEADQVTNREITEAIEGQLLMDAGVNPEALQISTEGEGVVTLAGSVTELLAKDRAVDIARSTKGVRSVIDRIEVQPPVRPDDEIATDVNAALLIDPATEAFDVGVNVEDGMVTLTGAVESWAERQLAQQIAAGVRGVRAIDNEIDITYPEDRSDDEIEREIQRRLESDVWVDARLVDIDVDEGKVKLSGSVGSAAERARARGLAHVAGVQSVDDRDLEVEPWAREEMKRADPVVPRDDEQIRGAIEQAFIYDPRVLSLRPDIRVDDGVVTLTGSVENLGAKRAAVEDARNTVGVWRVRDLLEVRPPEEISAAELEARVEAALNRDPYLEAYEIEVQAVRSDVRLSGEVDSRFERSRAEAVAARVGYVSGVDNELTVGDRWPVKSDVAIEQDIRDELYWNPWIDSSEVEVSVRDGVATLSGRLGSWFELSLAREEAFDGGALDVETSELEVEFAPNSRGQDY